MFHLIPKKDRLRFVCSADDDRELKFGIGCLKQLASVYSPTPFQVKRSAYLIPAVKHKIHTLSAKKLLVSTFRGPTPMDEATQ